MQIIIRWVTLYIINMYERESMFLLTGPDALEWWCLWCLMVPLGGTFVHKNKDFDISHCLNSLIRKVVRDSHGWCW